MSGQTDKEKAGVTAAQRWRPGWRGWLQHGLTCPTCRFYRRATLTVAAALALSFLLA